MGYFPFFVDIKDKKIIIVGGGDVAFRKSVKLMPFEPKITVIAPDFIKDFEYLHGINMLFRKFDDNDIKGAYAVIAATDDNSLNARIYELCREKNILVNTVDDKEKCTFIFPALVKRDDITIGISTAGKSPFFAKYLRQYIEDELDDEMLLTLETLGKYRSYVKSIFDTEEKRKEAFVAIFDLCQVCEGVPSDEDIKDMLEKIRSRYDS